MRIKSITARQIINGNGHPTLQVQVSTSRNTATATIPIAASKGKYEYLDAYDDKLKRFHKDTLTQIIQNITRVVSPELEGKNSMDQEDVDKLLLQIDNTLDRSRLGVNTIAAISEAVARLGAMESELPLYKYIRVLHDFTGAPHAKYNSVYSLPKPVITIYQSSLHNPNEKLPAQEIFVLPKADFSYKKDLVSIFENLMYLKLDSKPHNLKSFLGDIKKQLDDCKARLHFGLDMAAARYERKNDKIYVIPEFHSNKIPWRGDLKKLINTYASWVELYDLFFLEDPFAEDNYEAWNEFKTKLYKINKHAQLVSDDFTATSIERLDKISMLDCCNNVVIKPSQIGTVTECIHFAQRARRFGHNITLSYRHGETEDTFISDFAVGIGADYIRSGYYLGSEYVSKLNRLLQIEDEVR
jgi:enolase